MHKFYFCNLAFCCDSINFDSSELLGVFSSVAVDQSYAAKRTYINERFISPYIMQIF